MPPKVLTIREALKHPLRRRIVAYLLDNPGASVRQLTRGLGVSIGSLSGHLVILERVGLVIERRGSKRLELFVNPELLLALRRELADLSKERVAEAG
jgi:DNA-binding transcriptional ArsR family regulator